MEEPEVVEIPYEILKYFRNSKALLRSLFMLFALCIEVPNSQASYEDFKLLSLVPKIIYEVK